MDRRSFIGAGVGLGALAVAPGAGAGDPVQRVLREASRRRERVRVQVAPFREVLPGLDGSGPDPSLADDLSGLFDAFVIYGSLGDLSPSEQAHPDVQRGLWDAAEWTARGLDRLAARVEALGDERVATLQARLVDDPRLADLDASFDAEIGALDLPPRLRRRFRETARRVGVGMRRRRGRAVLDEAVEKYRRLQAKVAAARDPMALVRAAGPDGGAVEPDLPDAAWTGLEEGRKRHVALGALCLGLAVVGAGVMTVAFAGAPGLVMCVCVSVPMIVGVLYLTSAGISLLTSSE